MSTGQHLLPSAYSSPQARREHDDYRVALLPALPEGALEAFVLPLNQREYRNPDSQAAPPSTLLARVENGTKK